MTTPPGLAASALCAAADEALTEASFRTADFAEAERLFAEARDLRRLPSALVALGQAELAAGYPRHAAEFLYRAAELARAADLLPWRIRDAEQTLAEAESAVRAAG
jgi:hypothetical protein